MTAHHTNPDVEAPSAVFHDLRLPPSERRDDDDEIGLLQLEVLQAFGLPKLDQFGDTDAYCFTVCGAYAFRTAVRDDASDPQWTSATRRACVFPVYRAYARLCVGLFDYDGEGDRDDFAGRVVVDLARLRPDSLYDVTLPLRRSGHVYGVRPRGALRLRFKVRYHGERRMVLSYLPTRMPDPSQPDTGVTVPCCDRKAFQNVALTVHGTHMPGRFSMKMVKALIREVTFTHMHVLRYLRKREMHNLMTWRYPVLSGFLFVAWMHGVYHNTVGYVPGHVVALLWLYMWKNYATYGMEAPLHHGFVPPTWEELGAALLWGNDHNDNDNNDSSQTDSRRRRRMIQPLQLTAIPRRSPMELVYGPTVDSSTTDNNNEKSHPGSTVSSRANDDDNQNTTDLPDLYRLAEAFTRGVPTKKRRQRLTFTGADAVHFLIRAGHSPTRDEAVALGRRLQTRLRLFEGVVDRHRRFQDDPDVRYHLLPFERPAFVSQTHKPWGQWFFRMIGFAPDDNASFERDQMNFPFAGGADHPRLTVQKALCLRARETKKQRRLLKTLSTSSAEGGTGGLKFEISKGLRLSYEDDDDNDENDDDDSASSGAQESGITGDDDSNDGLATLSTSSSHDGINSGLADGKPGVTVIKLKPPTNQDIDLKTKADKPIGEVLDNVRDLVHRHMLHAFNVQTYVVKGGPATGAPSSKAKRRGIARLRNAVRATSWGKKKKKKDSSRHGNLVGESAHSQLGPSRHKGSSHTLMRSTRMESARSDDLSGESGHSQVSMPSFHDEESEHVQKSSEDLDDAPLSDVSMTNAESVAQAKAEYDKLLKTGTSSSSNPMVSKVGVLVQPLVESALGVLGLIRAIYNLFTWRDPLLSFWISLICPVIVIFLYIFPWRLILGLVGMVMLGPQNWVLRILRERRGIPPEDPDTVIRRIKPKKTKEDTVQEGPLFSSKAHDNNPIDHSTLPDDNVRHVVVPDTPLMFNHRFYDWPPEPQFADVKPDPTPIGHGTKVQAIASGSLRDEDWAGGNDDKHKKGWFGRKKKKNE